MTFRIELRPTIDNAAMNALFSAGGVGAGWPTWQRANDTSDWRAVLDHSLAYVGAFDVDDTLIGFVNVAWDGRDHAFLVDTRVHPAHRHRGLGVALVERAIGAARDAGCTVMHVDYAPELASFYEGACGFTPTRASIMQLNR